MPAPDSRRAFHLQSLGPLSALQVTLRSRFGNKSISPCAGSVDAISIGRIPRWRAKRRRRPAAPHGR